jgi:hypothetical protein
MSDTFACVDPGALVSYLYDECAAAERDAIAAHLSRCAACMTEVEALRSTRHALATWAPPSVDLGLQISRKDQADVSPWPASVLAFKGGPQQPVARALPWWRSPLPAWAQAAAAVLIFGAGLSIGWLRPDAPSASAPAPQAAVQPATPTVAGPTKEELAQLEQRLRSEMAQLARAATPAPTPVAARGVDDALIKRVQELLEQSEARQRVEFTERLVRQAGAFEAQRRVDLESVTSRFGQIGAVVRQHGAAIDENNRMLVRVSQSR